MAKRPASQFYWSDWLADTALMACSLEAQGLWMKMLCLMHEGDPYGHLRTGNADILPEELARMAGIDKRRCIALLTELKRRSVYSETEEGTVYSRRMVRDERVREARAKGGSLSTLHPNTIPPKETAEGPPEGYPTPPPLGGPPSSSSSKEDDKSSSLGPLKIDARPLWERFCKTYPRRDGGLNKAEAAKKFAALVKGGVDPEEILSGVCRMREWADLTGRTGTSYVPQMTTFLNQRRWLEDYHIPDDHRKGDDGPTGRRPAE